MKSLKRWVWVTCVLFLFVAAGCSSHKKEGEACERDSQCEGLLTCYKDSPDAKEGKCIKAKQARALYNKRKKEQEE